MGRILHLHNVNRWKGFSSSLIGSLSQTIITVFAAFIGFLMVYACHFHQIITEEYQFYLLVITGVILILCLIFYLKIHYFIGVFSKYKWAKNSKKYKNVAMRMPISAMILVGKKVCTKKIILMAENNSATEI